VGQATDIRVVLQDRREFVAYVLLADEESDLALLQLQGAADMPHLSLRSSNTVEVGELVLAIGNPFGVGQTVSSGIVSGLARSGAATGNARGYFIQTDAPINPGNSGGALIDTHGRLIGVNTSILSRLGGSNGIGFAIPASLVAQFLKQAADGNRSFTRPWAGAGGQVADADVSELLGLSAIGGVVITALHPMSPLKVAGIKVGDVVTAVAGQLVYTPAEMLYRMSVAGIGNTVQMRVVQGGVTRRYALGLIAPPETPARAARTLGDKDILSGVSVLQINPAVIVELGLPLNSAGVVVTDAGPLGPRIGLQRMDVLVSVNSRPVETTKDVARLLRRAGSRIELVARRGARQILLRFRL
jgi:S1-C subfamily serine protease